MNAPASVSTFGYWRLVACTLHVVKPDLSTAVSISVSVSIADISTGPVIHMKQETQLSQRDRATLRVIEYFAKPLKVSVSCVDYEYPYLPDNW